MSGFRQALVVRLVVAVTTGLVVLGLYLSSDRSSEHGGEISYSVQTDE